MAGIHPGDAGGGFQHFHVRPFVAPDLEFVRASHQTRHGKVRSEWRRERDGGKTLNVRVPVNTMAIVELPDVALAAVTEGARPARAVLGDAAVRQIPRGIEITLGSGTYEFRWK